MQNQSEKAKRFMDGTRNNVTNEQIKAPVTSNGSQSQLLSTSGFQHSDTNNVLRNALAIIVFCTNAIPWVIQSQIIV